ncbi:DnaJ C-terminal domain-containing protein [Haliea sp. E1-2-M8]|uniref:DnaJ C-terminal domain-containing protein n=1 Tax=Haliea sp. E1-2-M8 TaxID=3064706 RepID=UPI002728D21D|nr:DnaJ C-terminal domain-containing protein [Haliea sp. E1-2-M8]MDO8863436.1 DnaJ C-terminal domain-containing protein [Haliea sp. E1-2-M8]
MEFKDYYQILGVEPDAEVKDIKIAYRKLARKYHPDLNPEPGAEASFKEVAEAWEVLKDSGRRAEYDELRRYGGRRDQQFEPPPGWESSAGAGAGQFEGDFSDFFNSVFGADFSQQGPAGRQNRPGQDVEIELPLFLEQTLESFAKPVEYRMSVFVQGQLRELKKSLKVTIPAGVSDGERIRVRGQGAPGPGDGPAGDLYLHVRLVPHPLFDVEGHNLLLTVPIAPWEAALGAKITVPTLTGKISLTVKPNSQSGQKLRIAGKGLVSRTGRGDLYVVLNVVIPQESPAAVRALWQQLAEQAAFDPRAEWGK